MRLRRIKEVAEVEAKEMDASSCDCVNDNTVLSKSDDFRLILKRSIKRQCFQDIASAPTPM